MSSSTMLTLMSKDKEVFTIEQSLAIQSVTIKALVDDDCASSVIPLPNVDAKTLTLVIEFLKKHALFTAAKDEYTKLTQLENKEEVEDSENGEKKRAREEEKKKLDLLDNDVKSVCKDLNNETLLEVIQAANYLNIRALLDVTCQQVADSMKGKTPEEIRKMFKIKNDFTPEEEEAVRKENPWVHE
ncbi:S-phase kinase-associated protein 1-like protein [Artemisia annua]|uniref:SKP1-like protein n=1 Tax=Artemisia annua TaxID=35608 RepID=A0A2U1MLV1_ARTAN|nr:S-phase kinase-associated protein 1-like protein [Artemisia annua]PWA62194.1 S-phase kinase-associated protein 1-like protein [Artemisia annua]